MLLDAHKFNADVRAKIPKQKQRVTTAGEYDESLRQRGDLTVWIRPDDAAWRCDRLPGEYAQNVGAIGVLMVRMQKLVDASATQKLS